jgi:hypothetical protein
VKWLRLLEQKLIPVRATAEVRAAYERYVSRMGADEPMIAQGFEEGYAAAMNAVAALLDDVGRQALRDPS